MVVMPNIAPNMMPDSGNGRDEGDAQSHAESDGISETEKDAVLRNQLFFGNEKQVFDVYQAQLRKMSSQNQSQTNTSNSYDRDRYLSNEAPKSQHRYEMDSAASHWQNMSPQANDRYSQSDARSSPDQPNTTNSRAYLADDEFYTHGNDQNYIETKGDKKKPYEKYLCCCCCPKSKKGRIICGSVTAVVLITLGVIMYFFMPRMVGNYVNGVSGDAKGFKIMYPNDNKNLNEMTLSSAFEMNISLYNPNIYDLKLDALDLTVNLAIDTNVWKTERAKPLAGVVGYDGQKLIGKPLFTAPDNYVPNYNPQVGTAQYGVLNLPSKANVTFVMTLNFVYSPDKYLGVLKDPTIIDIAAACGVSTGKTRRIALRYAAKATIGAFKSLGIYPTTQSGGSIDCPLSISADSLSELESKVNAGKSIPDALSEVFGW
ncbi:hypothetical protein CcCBS67573_g00375 [Chytriomyces confervae]|uniref:Late embryogenesis abundant protein LEA-2 subgroup domain-containing protein n=1 Tax=Chytriomyces confervae TaxID=246404 RepID=A0A507FSE3_9FUNG|nr:hypothetical protein CcCBS67573_g00375 [Chytriomyces confervae]